MNKLTTIFLLFTLIACSRVLATNRYVSLTGTNDTAGGYTNWAGAATNIQDAVAIAVANDTIWVTNGTYNILRPAAAGGGTWAGVYITTAITLKSVNGATNTIINGNYGVTTGRCVYLTGGGIVDGFTLKNAYAKNDSTFGRGGGAYMYKSTVRNCIITSNRSDWSGGGVYMYASETDGIYTTLENCMVSDNTHVGENGGGVTAVGHNNGLNPYAYRAIIRNCLITRNVAVNPASGGGGVFLTYASMYNCTIVSNRATAGVGGGLHLVDGNIATNQIFNNIIYYNRSTNAADNNYEGTNGLFANNCVFPAITDGIVGTANNITNEPLFMDTNSANYRLNANSPCINTGTNQTWMTGAVDLDGHRRIDALGRQVDMGCYEYSLSGTMFIIR